MPLRQGDDLGVVVVEERVRRHDEGLGPALGGGRKGPIEGQINRLKLLKRQMFGRARLDRLARRFLLAA
jgi:transposase